MRRFVIFGLLLLGFVAGAVDENSCTVQFASLDDPFGPILIYAGAPRPAELHFRKMSPEQRAKAAEVVKHKLLRARHLVRTEQWELLGQEISDVGFMAGTGLTSYEPEAKTLYVGPGRLAELKASPERLKVAKAEILSLAQWEESPECCRIKGTRVRIVDPLTKLIVRDTVDLAPLTLESSLLMSEEIIHHLQALQNANQWSPFASKALSQKGFEAELVRDIRKALIANPDYLTRWITTKSARLVLDRVVETFKKTHPEGAQDVSLRDRAIITALPNQFAALTNENEKREIGTREGDGFRNDVVGGITLFFTSYPTESEELIKFIVDCEMREADAYLLLKDLYGPKLIDSTWRNRYLSRKVADRLLEVR